MAYTADDLRKMRERGTTRASSSNSKRKYTADDLWAMRGKSVQDETTSLYDSYAKQAVSNTPKYRYNSLEQYDTALKESKPKNDFAKRVANAGINALNALSGIGLAGTGVTPIKNLPYNKEEMAYNDLKKERNLYAQEHMLDEYQKKYKTNADFVAKSHNRGMRETLDVLDSMRGDTMYSSLYENMTDDEKAMANYLSNISESDPKAFEDYMMNMRASVNKREFDKKVAEKNAYMNEDGLKKVGRGAALSAESVGENALASIGTAGEYLESYLGGWNPDPYSGASGLGNLAMAEREAVSKDMGEVGSFVYNTGMSVADSALGAALFGEGYSVLMGTNAFNTSYKDLYERGASRDEILLGALTAGAAETVFEKISLENLLKPRGIKDIKAFAKAWLEQAGVEASEEFFTEMTNIITDELTQGANSEVSQMIYQMRNEGRPEDEIQKAVANMLAKRVGEAALGGFLSGGAMGGMFIGNKYAQNQRIGRNTDREELSQALENINPESDVAKEYRGRDLTNLKDTEVGALVMDAYAQADKDAREKYQNAVRDSLENLGLSEGEVGDYYDAIFAEKPTKVQKLLRENETIKDIMRDVNTRILPEIDESARQNKYDIAKTVSNRQGVAKALKKSDLKVGAVTELNGEEVKVTDVIKDGDKITVVTNKGEADPAQLTLSAKDANLVMIASGMENNTMRKAYLNNYHGQNVAEYTDSFSTAYSYGKNGVSEETLLEDIGQTINLSIEDATNIYQQGASEIKKSSNEVIETSEEIKKSIKGFRKGTFDDSKIDKKKLSASQRGAYALAQLWTDMGINVSLFNDTSEDSENGYYKDGTVYINLSARYTKQNLKFDRGYVINTMAHELTHWMEDTDSEAFKALKTAIFNYYGDEKTAELVAKEQQRYEKNTNKTMSKKAAESEVIARACEDMLSDSDTIERILMGVNADTRNTIVTKIREFIDRLGEFLNKILHGNMSPSEAARMLRESAEEFERVRQIWAETFTSAVNTVQKIEKAYNDVTEDYTAKENQKEKFSGKVSVESTEFLMALHNIDHEQLLKTLKLGGFPLPSIAIVKQYFSHAEYGDCTVVFPKSLIDRGSTKKFGGDAYTPIFPTVSKKLSREKQEAIEKKVIDLVGGKNNYYMLGTGVLDYDNMTDQINRFDPVTAYKGRNALKYAFLQDTGNGFDIPTVEKKYTDVSNDALGALAIVLGDDVVNEMHEGGYSWYKEHPEVVDRIRLNLNEAYIRENKIPFDGNDDGKAYKKRIIEMHYHMFDDEDGKLAWNDYDKIANAMYTIRNRGAEQIVDTNALEDALKEKVDKAKFEKWLSDLFEGIVEKEGIRNKKDLFLPSGNRRSWEALHDIVTLENIVKAMQAQDMTGSEGFGGNNFFGSASKEYKSVAEMRKDIARLITQDQKERDRLREQYMDELINISADIRSLRLENEFIAVDEATDAITDAIRRYKTVEGIDRYLRKEYPDLRIQDDTAQRIYDLYQKIANMPTEYFESKPTGAVYFGDVAYVVIPDNSSSDLINALKENGITYYTFKHGNDENRTEVVNEHASEAEGTLFSNKISEDSENSLKNDGFEEKDSKTLGLTDERIDKLLSGGYYGSTQQNYAQAYITYMSPDDFLKLTTGKNQRALERIKDWQNSEWNDTERPAFSMDEFANTYDYQPIQLNIDEENHEVIGHEGRHRMWQIKQLGYNRVPVLLFNYDNKYTKTPIVGMDLMPQWFSEKDDSLNEFDKVIVRDLIPFSQGNRDLIKKKFGTESEADYKFNKKVDAEDLLGRNKRLEKENKALEADVQALKDYINANAELSEGKTWNPVDLNSVAKSLADKSKSNIDLKNLRKQLASAYTYITEQLSSGNESWEDIMDECYAVASDIYDEIKNKPTLSKTRITNEIKKAGVTADEETISQVQDVVSEASKEDFVRNLAVEVYNGYWKASTLKTSADVMQEKINKVKSEKTKLKQLSEKQQAKIKQLKFEHRKTMDWMLAEQKKADEIHYGKLIERVREDRDIKLKQLKQYVKDRDARVKDAAERRKLISKIYDVSQTLGKRLLNAEKGRKVPDVLKTPLANLLSAIDFSSQRLLGIKGGKDMWKPTQNDVAMSTLLDKVRMAVDRFNKGEADDDDKNYDFNNLHLPINFAQELDEIKDKLRTVEDAVGERSVYTLQLMSTEELNRLYEAIKAMRTAINNMNKIISTNNAHEVDYLGNEIMEHLDKLGDNKFENAVTNFMTVANKTPFYFFKHLGKGGQELFSFLQNGWDKLADNVEAIRDFTHGKKGEKPLYTADEFEKWKNTVRTYTIQEPTEDGMKERTFSITEAQMMSLYCLSKREQAMSHISQDGVVIDVIKTKRKYGKHDIKMQDTVHLIESELARILADVKNDDRMRTVADKLQEFMNTTCAEWGNEVTQKLYGTDEYTEKNYFPIHVNQDVLASEAKDKSKSIYGMLNQSFTKPLVENARNEIYISDIFDVFASHTGDMAKYNALALPIMDVIKVWNYKEQVDIGDKGSRDVKGVKKSITKAIGKAGNAYIGHLLRDLNGDAESGRYDKATMRLIKNYKTAAVAANLQTALLQPLSYIRAGYMVNGKYLRLALLKKPQVKKCLENIGVQKWKALGFYDTNLNIGLDRIISNGNTWMDDFIEKSLWLTEKMDEITWGYLYTAVELETKDKYPTLSGDKLNEVVAKRLRDVLYGTQVFDSTLSRTDMMRSKSTLVQMETAFGAEPILSVNMLMDAVTLFNQEKKQNGKASAMKKYAKLIGRAGLIYLLSSVVESVLRGVLGKLRKYDDDDKDRFEDIQQDILERTLEELDVLNKIPIVKEAMPYIRKFVLSKFGMGKNIYLDNAQMNEEVFNTIYQALNGVYKILDGGEMNYKTFEKIFKAVSEATGLPISNVLKELKTIYNNTIGDATGNMWK